MPLVDELLVTALDKREAVPEEGFDVGRDKRVPPRARRARPYRRGGKLAVGVVGEGAGRVALGDREDRRLSSIIRACSISSSTQLFSNADNSAPEFRTALLSLSR